MEETEVKETTEEASPQAEPDFNALGEEFNYLIVDIVKQYANKLPLTSMVKILYNLATDLIFNHSAVQIQYTVAELKKELAPKSKILL